MKKELNEIHRRPLEFCPLQDRREGGGIIKADIPTGIAALTVFATLVMSTVFVWAVAAPPPKVSVGYNHPEVLTTPISDKQHITSTMHLSSSDKIPHETYTYVEFCVDKDIDRGNLTNVLEAANNIVISLDTRDISLQSGCYSASFPVNIPETLPSGRYNLRTTLYGSMNAVNSFSIPFYTAPVVIK